MFVLRYGSWTVLEYIDATLAVTPDLVRLTSDLDLAKTIQLSPTYLKYD